MEDIYFYSLTLKTSLEDFFSLSYTLKLSYPSAFDGSSHFI